MGKEIITFSDIEVYQHKSSILIDYIIINKIVVSNKVLFGKKGFKYFTGYKDDRKDKPFCIMLPKMSACRRDFDETKYMSFLIKDDELLKNIIKSGVKSTIV